MPGYKRKFTGTSRRAKRGRYMRVPRGNFRSGKESVISTSRTVDKGLVNIATANRLLAYSFALNDLPNYTDFTNAFNEYMITGVKVIFSPNFNTNIEDPAANEKNMPHVMSAIDYNDAAAPANENEVLSNESCVVHTCGQRFERFIRPRCASAVWVSGVATGFGSVKNQWLDVSTPGVQHYGLKVATIRDTDTPGDDWEYRVFIKFYIKLKKML